MSQLAMLLPARPASDLTDAATEIRPATEADNEGLGLLLGSAFPGEVWDPERVRRELTGADDVSAVFVLEDDNRIVASASAREGGDRFPGVGYVHWVAVDSSQRGKGLGRQMVARVIDRFVADGVWPVILETDDARLPAIATYLGLGFAPHYLEDDHQERWSRVFTALSALQRSKRAE